MCVCVCLCRVLRCVRCAWCIPMWTCGYYGGSKGKKKKHIQKAFSSGESSSVIFPFQNRKHFCQNGTNVYCWLIFRESTRLTQNSHIFNFLLGEKPRPIWPLNFSVQSYVIRTYGRRTQFLKKDPLFSIHFAVDLCVG